MPILNEAQVKRKLRASTSLHHSNETEGTPEESGSTVENNMSVDTLIDPEDYESAGDTHFSNEEAAHPVLATKKAKRSKVQAAGVDDVEGGSPLNPGTTNVGTIDNEVDPADGYLPDTPINAADMDDVDPDGDDDVDFDADPDTTEGDADPDAFGGDDPDDGAVEASEELMNNQGVNTLEAAEGDEDDWDAAPMDDDADIEDLAEDDEATGQGGVAIEDVAEEPEEATAGDEDMSILDLDETPDDQVSDVAFASFGTRLMALKGNRVIASMTGRMAVNSGRGDYYLSDQFQEVTAMEMQAKGLRRGLKSMGFALAKVSLAKQSTIKAQVQKEVHKTTAAFRKVQASKEEAFKQSLAIASVGLNRQMFKGASNALKAHLEGEFRRLGISGANRILTRAFAEHGPAYAKQVIELATKISAMPEEVRDGYVDALDLNAEVMDEPGEDMVPIGADMDDEDEDEFGETIEASLARPGHRITASAAASGKFSVTANEILNGKRRLF